MIAAVCSSVSAVPTSAAAQHEHHVPPIALDTMTIGAERIAIELRSGATIVNVRESAAAGGSIADLLRTIPGVDLDADGRISMRGSTSVLVLMNGRRMALTGNALIAFLRQMPAASLERIESGTSASVRHGADGGAGVVNLIFRDDAAQRTLMRSVAVSLATDDHYMGSAAASGNVSNALDWNATYSLSGMRPRSDSKTLRWSVLPGDLPLQTDQDTRAREKHRLHSVLAGAAIRPTSNTSVALRGAYSWMKGSYRNRSAFLYANTAGDKDSSRTSSTTEHKIPSGELSAIASIARGPGRFSTEARASFADEDFRGGYEDVDAGYRYMSTVMNSHQSDRLLRNDLALKFLDIDVDVGHESQFRTTTATHDATHFDATVSQKYRHEMDVHAGYLIARRAIRGVRAEAGLRVESDRSVIRLDTVSSRTDVRPFPSIRAGWTDVRRSLIYRLAYDRRINRPESEMLNPYSMSEDDMNEVLGNPLLVPEVSDQLELGMERYGSRLTVQLTPFLRWTRDPIRPLVAGTAKGGSTTTLENLTRTRAAGTDGSVRARLAGSTVVTLVGGIAHMETAGESLRSSGVYATARAIVDLRLRENTTMQIYAYRRGTQAIEQGRILPAFTSELSVTRLFAGNRARVTMRLNDPLRSDHLEFRIADTDFTQDSRRRSVRPLLSLFASYAVGGTPREDAPARTEGPARIF